MKWSDANRKLQQMDKPELLKLLKALFSLCPANKTFFEASLFPDIPASLRHFKTEISGAVNPSPSSAVNLRRGRQAIREFTKAAPDDLVGRLDLMVHYVEQAAAQTLMYGSLNSRFYDSISSMLDSVVALTDKLHPHEYSEITERMRRLDRETSGRIGWGVCDHISEVSELLVERLNKLSEDTNPR